MLVICSVYAICFSNPKFIETGRKRHAFFKHLHSVSLAIIIYFGIIIALNVFEIVKLDHISMERITGNIYYFAACLLCMFLSYRFIKIPARAGIHLFRKGNRDVSKYSTNLTSCKMGFIRLIVVTSLVLILKLM
jgi:hypothetical protein